MKILLLFFCFSYSLYAQPPIAQPNDLGACDQNNQGFATFDLTSTIEEILNGLDASLYTVSFYITIIDAQYEVNAILNPAAYNNISNVQTIFVRVFENGNPSNFAITDFNLIVGSSLEFSVNLWTGETCNGMPFLLDISGTPNSTVYFTMNNSTELSVELDENGIFQQHIFEITETTIFCFTEIISNSFPYCSKSFNNLECYPTAVFSGPVLSPSPNLVIYESPFDGIATFDLTVNESIILNGIDPEDDISIIYVYNTPENPFFTLIPNPTAFENIVNNQTIFCFVSIFPSGCSSFVVFDLIVLEDDIVFIPDANFKAKLLEASPSNSIAQNAAGQNIKIDVNDDGEIQVSEALLVRHLNVSNSNISSLDGINSFLNLRTLRANNNSISDLFIENLNELTELEIQNNQIVHQQDISISSTTSSLNISLTSNLLSTFDLNQFLLNNSFADFADIGIRLSNNPLQNFLSSESNDFNVQIDLTLNGTMLQSLSINSQLINSITLQNNLQLLTVDLIINNATYCLVESNPVLSNLHISSSLSGSFYDFDVLNNSTLINLMLNNINSIDYVRVINNPLENLTISSFISTHFDIRNTNLEIIDLSDASVSILDIWNHSNLKVINLKNGVNSFISIDFINLPELNFVCANEWHINSLLNQLSFLSFENVNVNSYCSFTPGGTFYTLQGQSRFDLDNNGCNEEDVPFSHQKFTITNGTVQGAFFTQMDGTYSFPVQEGAHMVTPALENPSYFNVTPPTVSVTFPANESPFVQDFCSTANGIHPDLEVVVIPIIPAQPGFEAVYKIVYKNKGNQVMSQVNGLGFTYNPNLMQFVTSTITPSQTSSGSLQWSFANLMPFESRSVHVVMQINPPTHPTHPVNLDDELVFITTILPTESDEIVSDNTFTLNQTVIGSYDPNDITCLQGDLVSPELIGEFLHYVIRFENTGTAPATFVVVKVDINDEQFEVNSLQLLSASHPVDVRLNGSILEFIFQNIQLESGGHGNILLKMKTKPTLQVGNTVDKKANIFFDYNFPIETNEAETLFQALSVVNPVLDNLISIYPNPVKDMVNITIKDNSSIKTIELYDVQGRLLQTQLVNNPTSELNMSSRPKGVYFIKIHTDWGVKVDKLIKEY